MSEMRRRVRALEQAHGEALEGECCECPGSVSVIWDESEPEPLPEVCPRCGRSRGVLRIKEQVVTWDDIEPEAAP